MNSCLIKKNLPFMQLAVEKAKLCPEGKNKSNPPPKVAIVIKDGENLVGWCAKGYGYKLYLGENKKPIEKYNIEPNKHAEELLIKAINEHKITLKYPTAFVTLEPCTEKKNGSPGCAQKLIEIGIKEIYIGNYDPNPNTSSLAWRKFFDAGVRVYDFISSLRNEAMKDNWSFFKKFIYSSFDDKATNQTAFDFTQNGGIKEIESEKCEFITQWGICGGDSVYAIDHQNNVSIAKKCNDFDKISDPSRWFEDQNYYKEVKENEIVLFKKEIEPDLFAFLAVKILKVINKERNPEEKNSCLKIEYKVFLPPSLAHQKT